MVSEADKPQADPATGEPEVDAEGCATAHKHKVAEQNEKDLLFESADTWQHMEVPE